MLLLGETSPALGMQVGIRVGKCLSEEARNCPRKLLSLPHVFGSITLYEKDEGLFMQLSRVIYLLDKIMLGGVSF